MRRPGSGIAQRLPIVLGLLLFLSLAPSRSSPAQAQGVITFGETRVENAFPDSLTFRVSVSSSAGAIVSAEFASATQNWISSESLSRIELDLDPGSRVELVYTWETRGRTVAPSTPVTYYWVVTDSAGNQAQSETAYFRYDDIRFDWQILENEDIALWWHDKPASFGRRVFDIAQRALAEQRDLFRAELEFPLRILIYNNFEEFDAWHGTSKEWVGGEAFPEIGVTTQIVSGQTPDTQWLLGVVPHELSHLYFAQVTFNPRSHKPVWLNEGVAQYNEFSELGRELRTAEHAAAQGRLIPLSSLASGFGSYNEERLRLAYAEALSATLYLVETYGEEGLADLLAAYGEGLTTEEAFQTVLGVSASDFEGDWALWLGVQPGLYVTPTPWPLPAFPASPTPRILGGVVTATAAPIASPTSAATAQEPTPLPAARPGTFPAACLNAVGLSALAAFIVAGVRARGTRLRGRRKGPMV